MDGVASARNAIGVRGNLHRARGGEAGGVAAAEVVHVDSVGPYVFSAAPSGLVTREYGGIPTKSALMGLRALVLLLVCIPVGTRSAACTGAASSMMSGCWLTSISATSSTLTRLRRA